MSQHFLGGFLLATICVFTLSPIGESQEPAREERTTKSSAEPGAYPKRRIAECEGWTLHISESLDDNAAESLTKAIELLAGQLREIIRVVPAGAVAELKKVPLWLSEEYPNVQPRAEYHPDANWLKNNGRDPAMAQCVEFTDIRNFEAETRRMPNFVLHELAHAYHDRVLKDGFTNVPIRDAYKKAKASGKYDAVEQRFGDGRSTTTKAYAMTTPQEYFAESTEAYFSTNDFFPFNREQLVRHDAEMTELLADLWGVSKASSTPAEIDSDDLANWKHKGSIWINTTPDGANATAGTEVHEFPLCVRLYGDTFDFSQCQNDGNDLRFTLAETGTSLAYEIDTWDPKAGFAVLWVRIPTIRGNDRQEITLHWGNAAARPGSKGQSVFNESNGFASVWHLGETLADSTGAMESKDTGTRVTAGTLGQARLFSQNHGLSMGEKIEGLPIGSEPHTTEAWVMIDRPNSTIVAWGNEKAQGKVVMQYRSPSRINMDCYFSGGNIATSRDVPMHTWQHIVYTYSPEATRIYIDGKLIDEGLNRKPVLAIESPARFYVGGWYDRYDFEGIIDELRLSSVARDAAWIHLQHENQKPNSTLCGSLVKKGSANAEPQLKVTPGSLEINEGEIGKVTAIAEGAEKIYWELDRNGTKKIIETDRWSCSIPAGRVTDRETASLTLKAVYQNSIREIVVPIVIQNSIPEPELTAIKTILKGKQSVNANRTEAKLVWDGRSDLILEPIIDNAKALQSQPSHELTYSWTTSGVAVGSRADGERLVLTRAQGNGELTVKASVHNGGPEVSTTTIIRIEQPKRETESWIERPATADERPRDGQFIPRDGWGDAKTRTGTLRYRGVLDADTLQKIKPDRLVLRAFADSKRIAESTVAPSTNGEYALSVSLPAALQKYRCELIAVQGSREEILHRASDLLCGDVYLIIGQSNAVATDFGKVDEPSTSPWVRTFGTTEGGEQGARRELWGDARARAPGGELEIGYWGLELGKAIAEREGLPICIVNGAVGGTRIDQHQRNPLDPTDVKTIYGRLLWRVQKAGLTHGVRGIFWHQGENDQGADGPTNRFGYETYEPFFVSLASAWKDDYPNIEHYFAFQIWPKACAMGFDGSDNRLRDVQRRLPNLFSNLSVISTLGIKPPGGCHYPADGYSQFATMMLPLVQQKIYGRTPTAILTPPNLQAARWMGAERKTIELEFDSEILWNEGCNNQFYIGKQRLEIESGSANGRKIVLQLKAPFNTEPPSSGEITYLDSSAWSQDRLLVGANGLAALTFSDVPILQN
ncbi:MAG: DUF2341 domain-containing protein [Pirellula sp.]